MIVRLTSFKVSGDNTDEAKRIYKQEVVPELKKQKDNTNSMLLEPAHDSGEFISPTSWQSKEDADAYESSGKYKELVSKIQGLISTPFLRIYNTQ